MTENLRKALEQAPGSPPPWRHSVDDFVVAGRRRVRRRRAGIAVGSSTLTVLAAGGLLWSPLLPDSLRPSGPRTVLVVPGTASPSGTLSSTPDPDEPPGTVDWYTGPPRCAVTRVPDDYGTTPEWNAYFGAGYTYEEAALLARLWGHGTVESDAKICAGGELAQGRTLPILPGQTPATVSADAALQTYTNNGYTAVDAAALAQLWAIPVDGGLESVKVRAGREILDGQSLPLPG